MFEQTKVNQRASASALAVKARHEIIEKVKRPAPPSILSSAEKKIWNDCVQSMAADWFPPPSQPVLIQYCRHVVHADRIAAELQSKLEGTKVFTVEEYDLYLKMQERESKTIANLSQKLRLCPSTMRNDRWNKVMEGNVNTNSSVMPWDE